MPPERWDDPKKPHALADWLTRLEGLHSKEIDLGLDRIRAVWSRMGVSLQPARVITVAGTNGKGSTSTLVSRLLAAHGWRTGLYTSPHFLRFNERIVIGDEPVADDVLVQALIRVEQARADVPLTYFEFTTLAALDLFAGAQLDAVVLEVGLGGRLDATNLIDTDCALITAIGLDHTDWLGNTLAEIAREKAGIARTGKPLILGTDCEPEVFAGIAESVGAHLIRALPAQVDARGAWTFAGANGRLDELPQPALPLPSANLALHALDQLGIRPDPARVRDVLLNTHMPGRLQSMPFGRTRIWLDVAHNPQAADFVVQQLSAVQASGWHVILGMLKDKDVAGVVQSLATLTPEWHLVDLTESPRGHSAEELAIEGDLGDASRYDSVAAALSAVEPGCEKPVLVCGSFLTVTDALTQLQMHS